MVMVEAEYRQQPTKCKHCDYVMPMGGSFVKHIVCEHYQVYLEKVILELPEETQKELLDKVWDQYE
jgi:hypothetical protein